MPNFPLSVWSPTTKNAGDVIQPAHINDAQDEIVAIEGGIRNGTAPVNSSNSTVAALSVLGGSTFAGSVHVAGSVQIDGNSSFTSSTLAIGGVSYKFPTASPTSTGQALVCTSTGTPNVLGWGSVPTPVVLLKGTNGTDSNASATTVDSIAISGLTANDRIQVYLRVESVTQQTATIVVRSETDAVTLLSIGNLAGGSGADYSFYLTQRQGTATNSLTAGSGQISGTPGTTFQTNSLTTAWTGSWTLGLRHAGVTAGGTFKYSWLVYKLAGQ